MNGNPEISDGDKNITTTKRTIYEVYITSEIPRLIQVYQFSTVAPHFIASRDHALSTDELIKQTSARGSETGDHLCDSQVRHWGVEADSPEARCVEAAKDLVVHNLAGSTAGTSRTRCDTNPQIELDSVLPHREVMLVKVLEPRYADSSTCE
ncbi:hypothetical protein BU24DRAFT_461356 [Aaosphaeria arxii CBS 175.79]|uniref:Uncharacterized protein n=1 Tax=Aaosphaeria arxii CBS 175.79 TaxID=1450172 RepID=A0A6A5Y027_9PLEO|nr:uncharacterized protein BU24DRAFT_461356 [Aaosphaeria arxii CBS 175.79]KAF2018417.1 hypothetical protein BU24DRAFT_461356 [Aaosphaeria arxii CBS 175.79]